MSHPGDSVKDSPNEATSRSTRLVQHHKLRGAKSALKMSDLSRRQFLAHSAGIAGVSIGLGVGTQEDARAAGDGEIRLGLVGAGDRGAQLLSVALRAPGVRVTAVADVAPQARLRARDVVQSGSGRGPLISGTLDRLLELAERGKLDALVIATPPCFHAEQAVSALGAGLHVYLEKPLGLDLAECDRVRAAARRAATEGRVFQIGLQRRYNPRYLAGIEAIRSGRAGEVLFVRAQWHNLGNPARLKTWFYRREKSGDLLLEQACHQMDVFNWIYDSHPERACGFGGTNRYDDEPPGRTVMDHYGLTLEYPRGGKVNFSHVSYAIPDRRFSGIYELVFGERLGIDLWNGLAWDRSGKTVPLDAPGGSDTQLALEGFFRHIRQGEHPRADAEAGYLATAASLLGLRALDSGNVASWDEFVGRRG